MILIEILGMACLAHLVVDFLQSLNKEYLNKKPFSCDMCMGFWISILPFVAQYGFRGLAASAIAGVVADLIFRLKNRL